jgi:hypothetical protein
VSVPFEKDDGVKAERLALAVAGEGPDRPSTEVYWDEGRSDLIWGPEGSAFAVVRCRRDDGDVYLALDLARGGWLRTEDAETRAVTSDMF